jgi:hypothetical protein
MENKYLVLLLILLGCSLKQANPLCNSIHSLSNKQLTSQSILIELCANTKQVYQPFEICFRNDMLHFLQFKRVGHSHNDCIVEFPLDSIAPQQIFHLKGGFKIDFKDKKKVQRRAILEIMKHDQLYVLNLDIMILKK